MQNTLENKVKPGNELYYNNERASSGVSANECREREGRLGFSLMEVSKRLRFLGFKIANGTG